MVRKSLVVRISTAIKISSTSTLPLSRPRLIGLRCSSAATCAVADGCWEGCGVLEVVAMRKLLSVLLCVHRNGGAAGQAQHLFFGRFFNRKFTGDSEVVQDDHAVANSE